MSETTLRVGLVGAGGIGKIHLARYANVSRAALAAVCDPVEGAAQAAAEGIGAAAYSSLDEMLTHEKLDAVDICTPTSVHAVAAHRAIEAGLHVLCEKPLAQDPTTARSIVDAAAARGVLLMTAFCHRFHPPILEVKDLIDRGEMGTITMFRNRFAGPNPTVGQSWFSKKAMAGGGAFLDTSIHSIDLFRFLVGEVDRVQAMMHRTNPAVREVEDTAIALVSTADGRMGVIEACWSLPGGVNVVEVYGTEGVAMIHYWDGFPSQYKTHGVNDWAGLNESGPDRFTREIQHFVDACLGISPLHVTGADGLRAVEIAAQAYEAAGWG